MRGDPLLVTAVALALALIAPPVVLAATSGAGVELLGGGVVAEAPADVELPAARVDGAPVTVSAPVGPFVVTDTRAAAAGWSLVIAAPPPVDPLGRPLGAPVVVATRAPAVGGVGTVPGAPGSIEAPRAILTAPPGTGVGRIEVTPVLSVTVPATAATAVYTTTVTVTVS